MIRRPCPCPCAARVQSRGCKGRSPLHKKTPNLPLPHGGRALCERGSGGWGKNLVIWLVNPATKTAAPPIGDSDGRVIRQRWGKPPARRRIAPLPPRRSGSGAGVPGAVAPGEINQKSPPSPWGKSALRARVGGMGEKPCDMAGKSGDQNRRAPHRGQRRQGYPATPGQAPRLVQDCAPAPAPRGFKRRGAGGGSPRRNKPKKSPPSPRGKGVGGIGARNL